MPIFDPLVRVIGSIKGINRRHIYAITTVLTVAGFLIEFVRGIEEYRLQGRQERARLFNEHWEDYIRDPEFRVLKDYLEAEEKQDSSATRWLIDSARASTKFRLITVYEELALAVNSGLLKRSIVYYMFGETALRVDASTGFWQDTDMFYGDENYKDNKFAGLYRHFISMMREEEKNLTDYAKIAGAGVQAQEEVYKEMAY